MSQKPTPDAIEEAATEVPLEALEPATLRRLAEEFVTRDGTDYGLRERSLEEKVEGLMEAPVSYTHLTLPTIYPV